MKGVRVITIVFLAGLCNAKTLVKREIDLTHSNEIPHSNHIFKIHPEDLQVPAPQAHSKQSVTPSGQNFLSSPIVQSILSNLTIQNVLSDFTIQAVLMNPTVQAVLTNPIVQSILTNPQLQGLAFQALMANLPGITTPMTSTPTPERPIRTTSRPITTMNSRPTQRPIMELVLNGLDEIIGMLQTQISRSFPNRRG